MTTTINIYPEHLKLITKILEENLPSQAMVWAFGSRAKKTSKQFSDLDIAIDAGSPLSLKIITKISDAFEESTVPFRVDLIDWQRINDDFKKLIEPERIAIALNFKHR